MLLSIFSGGLWIIPTVLLIAAIVSATKGMDQRGTTGNPYYLTTGGVYSIVLFVICVASIVWMWLDK